MKRYVERLMETLAAVEVLILRLAVFGSLVWAIVRFSRSEW
jgi:hypothetical protein